MSRLGPSFMKIWTCGSPPQCGSQNAWTRIKKSKVPVVWATFGIFPARSKWFLVGHDWWSWTKPGYITMTWRQSNNQWNGCIGTHPAPNLPSAKILWKSSRLDFLGSRRYPPHWLSSREPNYQRGVIIISVGAIEGHFEGKTTRGGKVTKSVLFLHDNAPAHRALATQKKLAYLGFQCLDHPPFSPDLAPSDYHVCPGLKKKHLKCLHFSSKAEVIAAAETWLDGQPSYFFEWLAKVRTTG